ncbi:hypothetical protein RDI58_018442 [Solanum bulbocastanum]|uniref:Uncharacterized protein n=1 Tax=Solanum bulbocastanum TaxID=147425 RepID=A0AAN8THB3_SOLBU
MKCVMRNQICGLEFLIWGFRPPLVEDKPLAV